MSKELDEIRAELFDQFNGRERKAYVDAYHHLISEKHLRSLQHRRSRQAFMAISNALYLIDMWEKFLVNHPSN